MERCGFDMCLALVCQARCPLQAHSVHDAKPTGLKRYMGRVRTNLIASSVWLVIAISFLSP